LRIFIRSRCSATGPASFFDISYEIDFPPDKKLRVNVQTIAPGGVFDANAVLWDPGPGIVLPVEIKVNHKLAGLGPGSSTPDNHCLEVNIPADFFGPGSDPFDGIISFTAQSDGMVDLLTTPRPVTDIDTPVGIYELTKVCPCPGLMFTSFEEGFTDITGCGFTEGPVKIFIDGQLAGASYAGPDGEFTFRRWPDTLEEPGPGYQYSRVEAVSYPVGGTTTEITSRAIGFLTTLEPIDGDIDSDRDVDLRDLARLANNWLEGK
jgi:hypothetical protein